jgi:hypothetical protein
MQQAGERQPPRTTKLTCIMHIFVNPHHLTIKSLHNGEQWAIPDTKIKIFMLVRYFML